ESPSGNWRIAGDVEADLFEKDVMKASSGTGILVNLPTETVKGHLLTKLNHGDIDLELEVMMAAHSNSGIYLQGRYEVQLLDSWGRKIPAFSDIGGIYHGITKEGQKVEGHAPSINAALAPGLWQKLKISFQAPRFDARNNKVQNAKIISMALNGYTIMQNVELTGPSGSPVSKDEAPFGPLKLQGDHGPVAFRNIKYTLYDQQGPRVGPMNYVVYQGNPEKVLAFDFEGLEKDRGQTTGINWAMSRYRDGYGVKLSGTMEVVKEDTYTFLLASEGAAMLKIDDDVVLERAVRSANNSPRSSVIWLSKGNHNIEVTYAKADERRESSLGVYVEGSTMRRHPLHEKHSISAPNRRDPIYLEANGPVLLRSFVSVENEILTRVLNVGHPDKLYYSYNLENGALIRIWKGDFLDTSPMWDSRGNGRSIPRGPVLDFYNQPDVSGLKELSAPWPGDYKELEYRSLGYDVKGDGFPVFRYLLEGAEVTDELNVTEGKYISRKIQLKEDKKSCYIRLAVADQITDRGQGIYLIGDKQYYIKVADDNSGKPMIRKSNGRTELLAPVSMNKFEYAILW
ncbi:MAG: DUF1080 domain-containing protein, partial [Cyclobacteriaceae bacterium]|nr:DUF1080 domain-containing protein [Cyclobacteriaceae bacterium]